VPRHSRRQGDGNPGSLDGLAQVGEHGRKGLENRKPSAIGVLRVRSRIGLLSALGTHARFHLDARRLLALRHLEPLVD
jgi:hypothetical protein